MRECPHRIGGIRDHSGGSALNLLRLSLLGGLLSILIGLASANASGGAVPGGVAPTEPTAPEAFATLDHTSATASAADFDSLEAVAEADGTARVIVGLRTAFTPEGAISKAEGADQRAAIDTATADVRAALRGSRHRLIHTYDTVPYVALELSAEALKQLEASGTAASLDEDVAVPPTLAQGTKIVEAVESAAVGRGGNGRAVAILDTGIDKTHPFLQQTASASKVVSEACYSANANCPGNVTERTTAGSGVPCTYAASGCTHGTHVAGIAAGKGAAVSGVAKQARLIAIQVFSRFTGANCAGAGEDPCTLSFSSDQLKGLERVFAIRNQFDVASANMSLGGGQFPSACDANPLKAAVDNLRSARVATVIASGNDGFTNAVGSPGCISTAVTVGSTGDTDQVSFFSNSSSLVDFFAPGEDINSSVPGGGFGNKSGTSMATPHVAGAWAIAKQVSPTATVTQVEQAMNATGKSTTDPFASPPLTRDRIRVLSAGAFLDHTGLTTLSNLGPVPGGGIASAGVGLARRTVGNPDPTTPAVNGNLRLRGIPAGGRVRRAFVVYQTLGAPDPAFRFDGVNRTATLIGAASAANCWSTNGGGALRTYLYTVPNGVVTGNADFPITGVGGTNDAIEGRSDGQGASLVVIYDIPGASTDGRAYLKFGAMHTDGSPMSHTFTGLTVPAGTTARALRVGIGDGQSLNDPPMLFGGTAITAANFWAGAEGTYWDDQRIVLPAARLPVGTTSVSNSQAASSDCLSWAYAGLTYQHP